MLEMKILLSHATGNQNVRHALRAFLDAGLLEEFWTSFAWRSGCGSERWLPVSFRTEVRRRSYDPDVLSKTRTAPLREVVRNVALKANLRWLTQRERGLASLDRVIQNLDGRVAHRLERNAPEAVYAYEDGALQTFKVAREQGVHCIYEHPVGYWKYVQTILEEERAREPEYASILSGTHDSTAKRERKDAELGLAGHVVVPSRFSFRTLEMALPSRRVSIVNYGFSEAAPSEPERGGGELLRVLFVGALHQQKGLSYLIRALSAIKSAIEISVVGVRVAECDPVDRWLKSVNWFERLQHSEVLELMRRQDVLVLPSLSDGFGLVVSEAMSQGLAVIVTENTGAADVVDDGINGYVVQIRSPRCIAERLERLHEDRELLMAMRLAAWEKAKAEPWSDYRETLVKCVTEEFDRSRE